MGRQPEVHDELVGHFVATAKAHHEATGGTNPNWAEWYAERLLAPVNELLGSEMTVAELGDWLVEADRRYRDRDQDVSWPKAYASWILSDH